MKLPSYNHGACKGVGCDVNIGRYTSIAEGVLFDCGFNHDASLISTYPFHDIYSDAKSNIKIKGDINIGNDVWIGYGAIVMSGVTIGDGAIIGAGSIVTKDIPPYAVAVGAPIRVKRYRFSPYEIEQLLIIKWWEFPSDYIKEIIPMLHSPNIQDFINKHKP
jgi:acetyltransferase-like isoleucine patch superfamily enzyme